MFAFLYDWLVRENKLKKASKNLCDEEWYKVEPTKKRDKLFN